MRIWKCLRNVQCFVRPRTSAAPRLYRGNSNLSLGNGSHKMMGLNPFEISWCINLRLLTVNEQQPVSSALYRIAFQDWTPTILPLRADRPVRGEYYRNRFAETVQDVDQPMAMLNFARRPLNSTWTRTQNTRVCCSHPEIYNHVQTHSTMFWRSAQSDVIFCETGTEMVNGFLQGIIASVLKDTGLDSNGHWLMYQNMQALMPVWTWGPRALGVRQSDTSVVWHNSECLF